MRIGASSNGRTPPAGTRSADPMFPPPHGEALADAIPGAKLLRLNEADHGVECADRCDAFSRHGVP